MSSALSFRLALTTEYHFICIYLSTAQTHLCYNILLENGNLGTENVRHCFLLWTYYTKTFTSHFCVYFASSSLLGACLIFAVGWPSQWLLIASCHFACFLILFSPSLHEYPISLSGVFSYLVAWCHRYTRIRIEREREKVKEKIFVVSILSAIFEWMLYGLITYYRKVDARIPTINWCICAYPIWYGIKKALSMKWCYNFPKLIGQYRLNAIENKNSVGQLILAFINKIAINWRS